MYMHMESKYFVINKQGSKNTLRLCCLIPVVEVQRKNWEHQRKGILLPYPGRYILTRNVPQRGWRSKYFPLSHPCCGADAEPPWRHSAASLIRSAEVRPRGRGSPHQLHWSCFFQFLFWLIAFPAILFILTNQYQSDVTAPLHILILVPCIPGHND